MTVAANPTDQFTEKDTVSGGTGKVYQKLLRLIRPYWGWLAVAILLNLITAFFDNYVTFLRRNLTDRAIIPGNIELLWKFVGFIIGVTVLMNVAIFASILIVSRLSLHIEKDLRERIYRHIQTLQLSYFSQTPVGWILSRVTSDTTRIADVLAWGLFDGSYPLFSLAMSIYFMMRINVKLALIVVLTIPLQVWLAWFFRKKILENNRIARKMNSLLTGAFNENITGLRVVKSLQRERKNLQEFGEMADAKFAASFAAARWTAVMNPTIQLLLFLTMAVILWNSRIQLQIGGITIGGIEAFVTYFTMLTWPVQELARVYGEAQQVVASGERYLSLAETETTIADRPGAIAIDTLKQPISFIDLSFHYDDGDKSQVLKKINLKVNPGEIIALVGSTGGGKTTLVNLLARFYEPTEGVIRIGARDYRDYTLYSYQSKLGIVLQTPHLFSGSIRENIRYGRLDATDAEIEEAALQAGADDFIRAFPKGYDEEVGEAGNLLSVGQKQLISIARAILSDPQLFILDEATSSVDTLTEDVITRSLDRLMSGRTTFIIAHRLSTIKRADRILVIEHGEIVESGNHLQLLKQRGRYYELYSHQFRIEREETILKSLRTE